MKYFLMPLGWVLAIAFLIGYLFALLIEVVLEVVLWPTPYIWDYFTRYFIVICTVAFLVLMGLLYVG